MDLTDQDCHQLLEQMDEKTDLSLTDWELSFLENNIDRKVFSEKQKNVIRRLMLKYDLK